jgi:hypothetical protein
LATAVISVVFGLGDLNSGEPDNTLAVTGQSTADLTANSPAAYALIAESVRIGGVHLMAIGLFAIAVLLFGFRRNARWAWWTMWLVPLMTGMLALIHFTTVAPGQGPAVPAYSGSLIVVLDAIALLASAPPFFRRVAEPAVAGTATA